MSKRDGEGRTALVTGASAGIGPAFAHEFARHGFDLVLVARREGRLQALAEDLRQDHGVNATVLPADLSDRDTPERLWQQISERNLTVDALVNNAGFGVPGDFRHQVWQKHADFLQVMVTSVVHLTHLAEPAMVQRGYGRILNVASLAGLIPPTGGHTLYGAAKRFVIDFSEALAQEHRGDGLHVTAVCPGFTYSEFHDVLGNRSDVQALPSIIWMDADSVARLGYAACNEGRSVAVTGRVNRAIAALFSILPGSMGQALMKRPARKFRVRSGD
jgi:hypothetical protein